MVKTLYKTTKYFALALVKIFFRLEVKGRDNIPRTGGFILASNHASYLDPIVLAAACPRVLNFMARHDLFVIPVFGAFIRAVGAFRDPSSSPTHRVEIETTHEIVRVVPITTRFAAMIMG